MCNMNLKLKKNPAVSLNIKSWGMSTVPVAVYPGYIVCMMSVFMFSI